MCIFVIQELDIICIHSAFRASLAILGNDFYMLEFCNDLSTQLHTYVAVLVGLWITYSGYITT